jgi:DNA-binding NarL/FixJ family response regulator
MKTPIRVGVVEDDPNMRGNLARLLNETEGFACVAKCASAEEAFETIPLKKPDVVLMDIGLPGRDGIQCVAELRQKMPEVLVIMLTIEENVDRVFESLKAGATGYLVKLAQSEAILDAISEVHAGGAPMSSSIARRVVTAFRPPASTDDPEAVLSPREQDVLALLAKGNRAKAVAEQLGVTYFTVNSYVRKIYKKLHVRSHAEAVAKYKLNSSAPFRKP